MKRKQSILLLLFISITYGIILTAENSLSKYVFSILNEEISNSCQGCKLESDYFRISLITLRGTALKPRITRNGSVDAEFKELKAKIEFLPILKKELHLHLKFVQGIARGVSPRSTLYKVIDYLTESDKKSKKKPIFKTKLNTLKIVRSRFSEKIGRNRLYGNDLTLDLFRTAKKEFKLYPKLKSLDYRYFNRQGAPKNIHLGKLRSEITIIPGKTNFNNLTLALGNSVAKIIGSSDNRNKTALTGNLDFKLDNRSTNLSNYFLGKLSGKATLSGSLGNPKFNGPVKALDKSAQAGETIFTIPLGSYPLLELDNLSAQTDFDYNRGKPKIDLTNISGSGNGSSFQKGSKFNMLDDEYSGVFKLKVDNFKHGILNAKNIDIKVKLKGDLSSEPSWEITPKIEVLKLKKYWIPDVNGKILVGGGKPSKAAFYSDDYSLVLNSDFDNIEDVKSIIKLNKLKLNSKSGNELIDNLNFVGEMRFSGFPDTQRYIGDGSFKVNFEKIPHFNSLAKVSLKDGIIKATSRLTSSNVRYSLNTNSRIYLNNSQPSTVSIRTNNLPLRSNTESNEEICERISVNSMYNYSTSDPLKGDGNVTVNNLQIGCDPYSISSKNPKNFSIKNGDVIINEYPLEGTTPVKLNGKISIENGYDLTTIGNTNINKYNFIFPSLDHMDGKVSYDIDIKGDISQPEFYGIVNLDQGSLRSERLKFAISNLQGSANIVKDTINYDAFTGTANEGSIKATGRSSVKNIPYPELDITFNDFKYEVLKDLFTKSNGELKLSAIKGSEELKRQLIGNIKVNEGSFQKNFELISPKAILENIFKDKSKPSNINSASDANKNNQDDVSLDIDVKSDGKLFFSTNILEAEAKGNLRIGGSLNSPTFAGDIVSKTGWFGFNQREFSLTSGRISFNPKTSTPRLEILGESTLKTRIGEIVSVFVEASGKLNNPRVVLTSDKDLTSQEILNIIATAQDLTPLRKNPKFTFGYEYEKLSLLDLGSPFYFDNFFKKLTKIDRFAVEPAYNTLTATIQPSVIAEKKLSSNASILAQSLFGGAFTESRLKLLYKLTNKVDVLTGIESVSINQNNALTADVAVTILSDREPNVVIDISGNDTLRYSTVLSFARLNQASQVKRTDIEKITQDIIKGYRDFGFYTPSVRVICAPRKAVNCRYLYIDISEDSLYRVTSFSVDNDVDEVSILKFLRKNSRDKIATAELAELLRKKILGQLRKEGYLKATAKVEFEPLKNRKAARVLAKINPSDPVTFNFYGNTQFRANEFISTLNIFDREQPFGNNSIAILTNNISNLYQKNGFLNSEISYEKRENTTSRTQYDIKITEGDRIYRKNVEISGLESINLKRLKNKIAEIGSVKVNDFIKPKYIVPENIYLVARDIEQAYEEFGYPEAKVNESFNANSGIISYIIQEGEPKIAKSIQIKGLPANAKLIQNPIAPFTPISISEYATSITRQLSNEGYLEASTSVDLSNIPEYALVIVEPGKQYKIGKITIFGNLEVDNFTIRDTCKLTPNSIHKLSNIRECHRRLLKTGLFQNVEIIDQDPESESPFKEIKIKVKERPLLNFRIGSGYNSVFGVHLFGEATDKLSFSDGRQISSRADIYYDLEDNDISQGIASISFSDPDIFNTGISGVVDARFQKITSLTQEFNVSRSSLGTSAYKTFDDGLTISGGYTIASENITDVEPDVIIGKFDRGHVRLGLLTLSSTYDRRDNPLNPRDGYTLTTDLKLASEGILSEASFASLGFRGSYISNLPILDNRFYVGAISRFGFSEPFSNTDEIPITQRYYLGGRTTVRGFRENSLGPTGEDGGVIGGDMLQSNTLELQYLLSENTTSHVFVDSGNVFLQSQNPDLLKQRVSTGGGLRYLSPIGPVGFDIGSPVNRRKNESPVRFHFNIGTNF